MQTKLVRTGLLGSVPLRNSGRALRASLELTWTKGKRIWLFDQLLPICYWLRTLCHVSLLNDWILVSRRTAARHSVPLRLAANHQTELGGEGGSGWGEEQGRGGAGTVQGTFGIAIEMQMKKIPNKIEKKKKKNYWPILYRTQVQLSAST